MKIHFTSCFFLCFRCLVHFSHINDFRHYRLRLHIYDVVLTHLSPLQSLSSFISGPEYSYCVSSTLPLNNLSLITWDPAPQSQPCVVMETVPHASVGLNEMSSGRWRAAAVILILCVETSTLAQANLSVCTCP